MPNADERLRTHPAERFADQVKLVDLSQAFASLPHESLSRQGHMQKALYRHGKTTSAIFAFEVDGGLTEHAVEGEAIIHVLEGRVTIRADGQEHTLTSGNLLFLDSGIPHDLTAHESSRILLHVALDQ